MNNNYKWETVGKCKFYTDGTTCTDIEVMDDAKEISFIYPKIIISRERCQKVFSNIETLLIGRNVISIVIPNKMFPNVKRVQSKSSNFLDGKYLIERAGRKLLNAFGQSEDAEIDFTRFRRIGNYAFEGCKAKVAAGIYEMRILAIQDAAFVGSGFLDKPFIGGIKCLGPFIIDIDETADEIILPKSDVYFCVPKIQKKCVRVPNINVFATVRKSPKKVIIEDENIRYDDDLMYKLSNKYIEELESRVSRYKTVDGIGNYAFEGCKAKSAAGLDEMRIAMVQEAAFVNSGFLDQPFVGGIKCLGPFIIDIDETADEIVLPKSDVSFCVKKRPKKAVRVPNLNAVAALRVLPKKVIIEDEKINYDDALLYKLYSQDIEEIESHISRYKTVDGIVYSADMKTLILCPQGKTGEVIIPDGVVRIRKSAFSNSKIKKVIFPDTMQTIGDEAFYACEKLKEIDFGHGITRIGENGNQHMFSGCAFKKITFPPQIKEIGISAFSLCRELEEVIFNEGLEVIQKEAFQNCQNLLEINLPASIKKVGMDAFVCNARRDKIQDMNINMTTIPEGLALAIIRPGNIHRTRCINVHIDNQDGIFNFVLPCSISATASVYGAYSNIVNVFNQMAYRGHDKKLWNLKCLETAYLHASYPRYVYVVAYKTYRKTKNKYTKEFLYHWYLYLCWEVCLREMCWWHISL